MFHPYRITLVIACALALASSAQAAPTDLSMLRKWTPHNRAEMRAADPVALAYLSKGWWIVGDRKRANVILDELERRGRMAYTAGRNNPRLNHPGEVTPPETMYTIALIQVADAYRVAGRTRALAHALKALRTIPVVDGGCYAYSSVDGDFGCVQDAGGLTLAVLSHLPGWDYSAHLRYEQATILPNGSYRAWEPNGPVEDAAHLAWTAFMLMESPDPTVRDLGRRAARFVGATYDPSVSPPYSLYAVAAARIRAGLPDGCALAARLPGWANSFHQVLPDETVTVKNQMWAAYVFTWAQTRCR